MIVSPARLLILSLSDLRYEWPITLCIAVGVAAALAPLLILFSLKNGLVTSLLDKLREDPRTREVRLVGQGHFDPGWFETASRRPDVAFVVPMTRFLTASMDVVSDAPGREAVTVELFSTAAGDPLLSRFVQVPEVATHVVLTRQVAESLGVAEGDTLTARVGRFIDGDRQLEEFEISVLGVLPAERFQRKAIFITLPLLVAIEAYREGSTVHLDIRTPASPVFQDTRFASFRLYARSVYEVSSLRDWFAQNGHHVVTDAPAIERVLQLDRSLTRLFGIISVLAGGGLLLTSALSFWASVSRKRRELCVLRLLGFSSASVALYPVLQAFMVAVLGAAAAIAVELVLRPLIEGSVAADIGLPVDTSGLRLHHFLIAIAATVSATAGASALAGWRAARMRVPEGLRDG